MLGLYDIVPGCEGPEQPQHLCDWLDNDLSALCSDESIPLAKRKLFSAIQLWRDVHAVVVPTALVVYTDGSANAGRQASGSLPAAWAVSVWVLGDKEYLLGGAADTYAPPDDRRFIGADEEVPLVSEQLALAWGLVWIIQYAPSLQLPVVLRYDCQAAGRGAFGAARAPCASGEGVPSRLSMFVCHLRQIACARVKLSHEHVHAHRDTPQMSCVMSLPNLLVERLHPDVVTCCRFGQDCCLGIRCKRGHGYLLKAPRICQLCSPSNRKPAVCSSLTLLGMLPHPWATALPKVPRPSCV